MKYSGKKYQPAEQDASGEALAYDGRLGVALLVGVPEARLAGVAGLHLLLVVDVEREAVRRVGVEETAAGEALHAPAAVVLARPAKFSYNMNLHPISFRLISCR